LARKQGPAAVAGAPARIWDLPTRLVHWLMAGLIPFSWWSATHAHLDWHRLSGYALLGLLAFRLLWGVVGSPTARFSQFLAGPRTVAAYVGGRLGRAMIGHNPLGGWSIAAMLSALALQIGLGLFSVDEDDVEAGPLARFVDFDTGRAIAHWHHKVFWVLAALIALHLLAILVYAIRRRNLVGPMITGVARLAPGQAAPGFAPAWRIAAAALLAAALAGFVARGLALPRL
jgi:cytochrome b